MKGIGGGMPDGGMGGGGIADGVVAAAGGAMECGGGGGIGLGIDGTTTHIQRPNTTNITRIISLIVRLTVLYQSDFK